MSPFAILNQKFEDIKAKYAISRRRLIYYKLANIENIKKENGQVYDADLLAACENYLSTIDKPKFSIKAETKLICVQTDNNAGFSEAKQESCASPDNNETKEPIIGLLFK